MKMLLVFACCRYGPREMESVAVVVWKIPEEDQFPAPEEQTVCTWNSYQVVGCNPLSAREFVVVVTVVQFPE